MKEHKLTTEILESSEFYDTLRGEVVPCMSLVAVCDEGKVYFWDDFVTIMVLVGERFAALVYAGGLQPEEWLQLVRDCNKALDDPESVKGVLKSFNYFASIDSETGEFTLHTCHGGDWCGIYPRAKQGNLARLYCRRPYWWPESYQKTIDVLNKDRGEDDSLASKHQHMVSLINHTIHSIKFGNLAATFDVTNGRLIPPQSEIKSDRQLPIQTYNVVVTEPVENFECDVDSRLGTDWLQTLLIEVMDDGQIVLPQGKSISVPQYGIAALGFIHTKSPDVTKTGQECFMELLSCLPGYKYDYESLRERFTYDQLGSGIVLVKLLLEGMLGLGGDLFPSHELRRSLGYSDPYLHGTMAAALEIQWNVILKLTKFEREPT
jgi:hypothetical protein